MLRRVVAMKFCAFLVFCMSGMALAANGSIQVHLQTANGDPIPYHWIMIKSASACSGQTAGSAQTDANGDYSLASVAEGQVYVQAYGTATASANYVSGWWQSNNSATSACSSAQPVTVTAGQNTSVTLVLPQGASISGTVTNVQSANLANVNVYAYASNGSYLGYTTTDSQGQYSLYGLWAGTVMLYTYAGNGSLNYVSKWWDGVTGTIFYNQAKGITLLTGATFLDANFVLEPGGTLAGRITDQNGAGLANVNLFVTPIAPTTYAPSLTNFSTDADGYYSVKCMPETVFLNASMSGTGTRVSSWWNASGGAFDALLARPITIPAGSTRSGINLQLPLGGSVSGKITNASGTGLAGVSVLAKVVNSCMPWTASQTTTDADGNFTLLRVPTGEVHISASGSGYAIKWWDGGDGTADYNLSKSLQVAPGQTYSGVTIKVAQGGSVSGQVVDGNGAPLKGISVKALAGEPCAVTNYSASQLTDAEGKFTMTGIPAGTTYITTDAVFRRTPHAPIWWNGGSGTANCADAQAVSIAAGQSVAGVNLTVQNGGTVSGKLTTSGGAAASCLKVENTTGAACTGPYTAWALSDYDGSYTIFGVPTGSNVLRTDAAYSRQRYSDRYWDGSHGTSACAQATSIPVASGAAVAGIDMTVSPLGQLAPVVGLLLNGGQ